MMSVKTPITYEAYLKYKETEGFLDSLMFSKPVPHFVAPKHETIHKNPFGLERIASFLSALGKPHVHNRYIHITGTSGKTSTSYFLANILRKQGYRIGLFTSPHITTFAEYFMIDMQLPSVQDIIELIEALKPFIDDEYVRTDLGYVSHFECILSAALQYFSTNNTDYVVLEAALGGRYDATNVIEQAEVSVITNIGLDHTHILGETLQEIARDKAGIIKTGCPLITAEQRPELLDIFRQETQAFGAELHRIGQDFFIEHIRAEQEQTIFDYVSDTHNYREITMPMCGAYQASNAALAVHAFEIVSAKTGKTVDEHALREGIYTTMIPGRYEKVQDDPPVVLDGAHNPDKLSQLASYLKQWSNKDDVILVCGFTSGKNPEQMFIPLLEISETFYLTRALSSHRESEEPLYLQSVLTSLQPDVNVVITLDPFVALDAAMKEAQKQGKMVCVTGSLYLVAYIRQRWYPEYEVLNVKRET